MDPCPRDYLRVDAVNRTGIRPRNINFACLNCRSVCNKTAYLQMLIKEDNLDIFCLTETWLTHASDPSATLLTPSQYNFNHVPRTTSRGGGVGILYKNVFQLKNLDTQSNSFSSFEYMHNLINIHDMYFLSTDLTELLYSTMNFRFFL